MAKVLKSDEPIPEDKKGANLDEVREIIARIVRVVFIVFALVLALGAFFVAMHNYVSPDNAIVKFVLSFADTIDGPFSRENGLFVFDGENAEVKSAVVNWGVAAIVYLVIGRYLQRLLVPKTGLRK